MKRSRKRTLLMVLLLLAYSGGGAIINVAVAWCFAAWGSYIFDPQQFYSNSEKPRWMYDLNFGVGRTHISFVPDNGNWGGDVLPASPAIIPYWSRVGLPPANEIIEDATQPWCYEEAFGWPMRSAYAMLYNKKPARTWQVAVGLEIYGNDGSPLVHRVLPLCPIWPGFAINTIFYAAILWLLFAAPGFVRRRIRIKRGQCPACAYPIGTSDVCTECGRPIPPHLQRCSMGANPIG